MSERIEQRSEKKSEKRSEKRSEKKRQRKYWKSARVKMGYTDREIKRDILTEKLKRMTRDKKKI